MAIWEPRPEDLETVIREQNPWFQLDRVPLSMAPPTDRPMARALWRLLVSDRPRRYQIVLGPRRVGKTTVLYQTVRHLIDQGIPPSLIWWLRMDHPLLMQLDLGPLVRVALNTVDASPAQPVYLMLDELVYADSWDLWLKTFYDEGWPVRVAATSSATAALRDRRQESGVGRWTEQLLTPYLLPEYLELLDMAHTVPAGETLAESLAALAGGQHSSPELRQTRRRLMLVGGFPELLLADHLRPRREAPDLRLESQHALRIQPELFEADHLRHRREEPDLVLESQHVLRSDAVERALYKDIPQSYGVRNPLMLERLLYVLAAQVTGILSPSRISGELGISIQTLDRYLSYLERAFLVFTLPNYSGRETNVQKRGRKLYFVDGAVRNAALHRGLAVLDDPVEMGALRENLVAASLHALAQRTGVRLFHWRDGHQEVDLVFDHPDRPLAFEIASSSSHSRSGLHALIRRYPRFKGGCYLVAPQVAVFHPDDSGIGTLPLDILLLTAGTLTSQYLARSGGRPIHLPDSVKAGLDAP